jgi:hypothetical protein
MKTTFHEPSGRSAAFTTLQLPMLQELCTLKGRKRRAPVQGFNARIISGNSLPKSRRIAGILLVECLVYIAVFAILTSIGLGAFYLCWNQSKAVIYATDDIGASLRAGERWRADVRGATGRISIESTPAGELLRIPHGKDEVFYSYHNGAIRRKLASASSPELLFANVTASQMSDEVRGGVTAWRWELQLPLRRPETQFPLLFTFEAAQTKP